MSAAPPAEGAAEVRRPARFMVVVAHPDDAEFGCAATAARWIAEGAGGLLVCLTSGDAGSDDPATDPLELAARREAEQRAAAAVVGYADVRFLHRPDGALANDLALREQLVRELRAWRPDAVLTSDPETLFHRSGTVNHADHRAAGMAAVDAIFPAARNPMAFPHLHREGLEAHVVRRLFLFWSAAPTVRVEVTGTVEAKVAALRVHASQHRDWPATEARVRLHLADEGAAAGVPAAEAFRLIVLEAEPQEAIAGA